MADKATTMDTDAVLTERYEQLRQVVLDGHAEGWRFGLGVLATRGMAAWMTAWRSCPPPPPSPAAGSSSGPTPDVSAGAAEIMRAQTASCSLPSCKPAIHAFARSAIAGSESSHAATRKGTIIEPSWASAG